MRRIFPVGKESRVPDGTKVYPLLNCQDSTSGLPWNLLEDFSLAVELSPIRVNVVSPGLVDTPIYAGMPEEKRKAMFNAVAAANLVKRIGKPEDIAETVLYLMSNGYMTGSTLYVEGGIMLR